MACESSGTETGLCMEAYLGGLPAPVPVLVVASEPPEDEVALNDLRPEDVVPVLLANRTRLHGLGEPAPHTVTVTTAGHLSGVTCPLQQQWSTSHLNHMKTIFDIPL